MPDYTSHLIKVRKVNNLGLLKFEWGSDLRGISILVARKSRGKITVSELQEAMSRDYRYNGGWALIFKAKDDSYQGWGEEPKGDAVELYRVDDWETCPVCAVVLSGVEYCPHCNERIENEIK